MLSAGFVKEQLKLTYDEPMRSLNVRGECAIGSDRYVRFNKDFKIPDNARFNEMRARFQSETLIYTVPKQTLISSPPLPLLPPQAPKPDRIASQRTESPKEDDRLNNKSQESDSPGKLPPVDDRMEKERPSTLIPPTPLAPLPNPAPKPVPTTSPWTEIPKANNGMKDRLNERDDSVKLPPLKEMKVGMEGERKLMVNVTTPWPWEEQTEQ